MPTALAVALALALDFGLGEPRRAHPLVGFGRLAEVVERSLNRGQARRLRGLLALTMLLLPIVILTWAVCRLPLAGWWIGVGLLYLTIGRTSLVAHAHAVAAALAADDLPRAREQVARIVSRDTGQMNSSDAAGATVESVLENGNDAVFGALFWFTVAGAPGAVAYRLVNTLDAMWGYRNERFRRFGWAAARLDDLLNLVPARLTALSYGLVGRLGPALRCWRAQAPAWESPNAGPVMAAGAGALGVRLGGGAFYHGDWKPRPPLGEGAAASSDHIASALALVNRAVLLWLAVILIAGGLHA